ncbi:hypothetical protein AUR64_11855 [Haloprofundus marisrubri]|uniref:DUF7409 domain-containing protein n=1 Tax=Haloprofundus marisrubri TaxID=1514971 RepID=A0A0W1RA00_9EURY|nr:hypothetical protein [Haloprofundus marisrubri]KTG10268.1 hypothetical protein AUR64_11855 [Haloprofundus marisrubri]
MADCPESKNVRALLALHHVGPKTARALDAADVSADDVRRKRVSYTELVDAEVHPGVAARIRRSHSLSWSFESSGADLERRSAQVRGLGDAERAWVAASSGDWEAHDPPESSDSADDAGSPVDDDAADGDEWPRRLPTVVTAETDGSGESTAAEAAWRAQSRPTPLTVLDCVDDDDATTLAEAGIVSVRSLTTANPDHVADVLELEAAVVRRWYDAARRHREQ